MESNRVFETPFHFPAHDTGRYSSLLWVFAWSGNRLGFEVSAPSYFGVVAPERDYPFGAVTDSSANLVDSHPVGPSGSLGASTAPGSPDRDVSVLVRE